MYGVGPNDSHTTFGIWRLHVENDELVPLYHAQRLTTSEQSIDIIIVPGTLPDCQPDEYETKYSWIKSLIASTEVDTRVFLFYCHVATGSRELGDQLNSQSEYLRTALHNICVGSESQRRRLVFICHGDGGLIVKKMLTLDFKLDRNHEEVTSGLIFLETPHATRNVRFYSIDNYPVEAINYFKARDELVNSTLISRNSEISEIQIRRFVQSAVIQTMKESYDGLTPAFGATTRLLSDIWPYATRLTCDRVESDPKAEKLIAHILRIEALFGDDIRSGKISGTPENGYLFCGYARKKTIFWVVEAYHHLALAAIFTGSSDELLHAGTWINVMKSRRVETYKLPSKVSLLAGGYRQLGINYAHKDQIGEAIKNWQESIDIYRKVNNTPKFSGTWPSISLAYAYTLLNSPDEGEKDDLTTQESGHIWRAMGNIRNAQERFSEGLEYHQRSLNNLRSTLGEKHHFTGDAFYSLGVNYWQQKDKIEALQNLTAAINAFRSGTHTKAQLGRAIWKKGCILKTEENDCQAQELLMEARNLYHELVPVNSCAIEELEDENWTKLLVYWSR
ncbi:hypothetical protein HYALB_00007730 [Hymenoscyphus albidus]|uniref:DUF7779 domain-containing protein n=1 Tax=Hymenoscyphus albidus TaxID=595503 RepID=A0A9N9LGM8_9HELO|nr:hypothetical protein HYALB_00007730 [Hymenoscyphus albidus]